MKDVDITKAWAYFTDSQWRAILDVGGFYREGYSEQSPSYLPEQQPGTRLTQVQMNE